MPDWSGLRSRLEAEKARLEKAFATGNSLGLETSLQDSFNELSSYDNHPADLGSETFEREKDLGLLDRLRIRRRNIEHALERMERGEYGLCEGCGQPIPEARLEALPETAFCLDCQRKEDELSVERDRPLEEEYLGPPFGRTFTDDSDNAVTDGEDVWQAVARYGTAETPQDIGEDLQSYNEMYLDAGEHPGVINEVDGIIEEDYPQGIPDDPQL